MKLGIITHYNVLNHGAVLQLYALEQVLRKKGYDVKALTFSKNMDFLDEDASVKYNISIKSIPFYVNYMIKKGIKKTYFNVLKKKKLDKFKLENNMIGEYYSRTKDINGVFIGADEIFSIEPGLNPVFYGMGVPCKNVYSYAASFGPTNLDFIVEHNSLEFVNGGFNHLNKIGVRDKNSLELVKNISGLNAILNCDPVILYDFEEEKRLFKKNINEKYILVYAYDNNMNDESEVKEIKRFAKEKELKIYSVGFYHKWADKNINVNPLELMEYVSNAEFVVTDTFHGTVISIVMNTPFATKVRGNRNKLGYLLEEYDSLGNEIHSFSDVKQIYENSTDFNKINQLIEKNRTSSMKYLESCLDEIG